LFTVKSKSKHGKGEIKVYNNQYSKTDWLSSIIVNQI